MNVVVNVVVVVVVNVVVVVVVNGSVVNVNVSRKSPLSFPTTQPAQPARKGSELPADR
ncbi:hypothetical protein WMF31_41640 [Sorangium sp. So ce1036]|uniref:hypothetical protein n=1 Tax=Sorangium sp. So ce1036 TaxID=3133328 RepID=UPI003F079B89